jgi:hypothetical protein
MAWDLLRSFPKITVSLVQGDTGTYVNGEWVLAPDAAVPLRVIAPQPLTANQAQLIPDGEHIRDYVRSWSESKVFPREGSRDADRIIWKGDTYKVMQADDRETVGGFYAFEMRRLEPGTT